MDNARKGNEVMPLIPLNIPPGVYKNGTDLQASGRWADAHMVRWHEGTMQPHGGYRNRNDNTTPYPVRGLLGWKSNTGARYVAGGTYEKLYVWLPNGTRYDITPSGFTSGRVDSTSLIGYGSGYYGTSTYGTARSMSGDTNAILQPVTSWTLSTWGENLICNTADDGKVYEWSLATGTPAALLTNAPASIRAIIVSDERFLFCFKSREVYWSDQENNNTFTASATNQAGQITLQTSGQIVCAEKIRGGILILTTDDAHASQYIGQPFVHSIQRVGTNCGIISNQASVALDLGIVWMGELGFFRFSGGQVQEIPCELSDFVFSNLNTSQQSKCCAVANASFNEVLFFYPSSNSTENDSYASWNYSTGTWSLGSMGRTSGIDVGTYSLPQYTTSEFIIKLADVGPFGFAVGQILTGQTSTATAEILAVDASGSQGLISVKMLTGTFQAEAINNHDTPILHASLFFAGTIESFGHYLQEHETGSSYAFIEAPFVESGPIQIANGDQIMAVSEVIPDEKTLGSVRANFKTRLYPTGAETDHGTVTLANPTSVRFQGREVRMRLTNASNDWRVGTMRLNAVPGGKR